MKQELIFKKKRIISKFLQKNIILSPDLFDELIFKKTEKILPTFLYEKNLFFINKGLLKVMGEKERQQTEVTTNHQEDTPNKIKIISSYEKEATKKEVQDFVKLFNKRYETLGKLIHYREELQNPTSISRVIQKRDREEVSVIGLVKDKRITSNDNIILTLEDITGEIKVLINKNKPELLKEAKDIVLDEVIGVVGANGDKIIFANNLLWPEVPLNKELKKSGEEVYAIFLSDLHTGSKLFLEDKFIKFLKWIRGESGNTSQRQIAEKTKYVFFVGDLVDGVGIYPEQDQELEEKDIYVQYKKCAKLISQIPKNKKIIICPGNHDATRLSEPQLPMYKDMAKPLFEMPNVFMVSNPSLINIHSSISFPGLDILLYHGYSFDYYIANVESLRNGGGYDKPELVMKFLLRRRHLAPSHTSTLYIPDPEEDPLIINKIPDVFVSGHVHKATATNYRNISLISASCWQSATSFQEKLGHHPEPARVPIINLQTRHMKILRF